ncbi:MAG: helix-turn-helix domain-containing protein [Lactobacillaceae bacterium]|jgi:transcriptional regulator with XRE-family HTH domain|nr:helix-turn-helix domain-containing protein [Lactobacillaceae bacterium]
MAERNISTMQLGMAFKEIRLRKKMSLRQVSEGLTNHSYVSKFEKGEYNISLVQLMNLLDNMHVSYDEYVAILQKDSVFEKYRDYTHAMQSRDIYGLAKTFAELDKMAFHSETARIMDAGLRCGLQHFLHLEHNAASKEDMALVKHRLASTEYWTHFDTILVQAYVLVAPHDELKPFVKQVEHVLEKDATTLSFSEKKHLTRILLNCFIASVEHDSLDIAEQMKKYCMKYITGDYPDQCIAYKIYETELLIKQGMSQEAFEIIHELRPLLLKFNVSQNYLLIDRLDQMVANLLFQDSGKGNN